jgi:hypothetical protein
LSAAHSLYVGDREPNDLERTDRVLHIYAAIEAFVRSRPRDAQACERARAALAAGTAEPL